MNGIKARSKYPDSVRKFCFTLSYHSPAAYEVIRKAFNNNLPHRRTLKSWLASSDISGEAGITQETLDRLKKHVDGLNGQQLICSMKCTFSSKCILILVRWTM